MNVNNLFRSNGAVSDYRYLFVIGKTRSNQIRIARNRPGRDGKRSRVVYFVGVSTALNGSAASVVLPERKTNAKFPYVALLENLARVCFLFFNRFASNEYQPINDSFTVLPSVSKIMLLRLSTRTRCTSDRITNSY